MSGSHLLQDHLLTLENVQGCRIECHEGQLWLTAGSGDIILQKNESWLIEGESPVVIQSMANSQYTLHTRYAEQLALLRHFASIMREMLQQVRLPFGLRRPAH
ncbi:DUF2917 domain-containing protein [Chitinilyticum piscinae]|uniref:DUF2917 domain-containing protein n=1 Tax=Chitinilyticum piscinae TaxID=2866724 RepID=A0A8J7FJ85_9NEIS|nr:DUF2917 domain-containing protein [Chitinilyticum piscinae]MBE9608852.1 DUF2917 domain-containing protein [Chitinilyticum piscinae]